ncbi:MAG: biopolymer transporter ExbD [Ignavibacteria bacterium]|jgi:biopolymer transport protein ExbD|nr:biopolymer transporter ExbD [Ignavibacteria bacterium]MDH7526628.1 biopolymer transporter ExbD [Ignavibacteria bacterium]NPV11464.1 biopolymer transporter ExbD [Ignavibacteria bacterium]
MKFESETKLLTAFNYSSLTDIVMLLLIFFLLTSQFVITTGVQVKLPKSETSEPVNENQFIVTITKTNDIYFGSERISLGELADKIIKSPEQQRERNLVIKADKEVPIEILIKVIDIAKSSGINKFTIATEKESL